MQVQDAVRGGRAPSFEAVVEMLRNNGYAGD